MAKRDGTVYTAFMENTIRILEENGITYECIRHPAVYTIAEMTELHLPHTETVAKNLFLRDDKKRNYYLLTVRQDLHADLKKIRQFLACRPLGFASEADLGHYLGLSAGEVTPLGLLNDAERKVTLIMDTYFRDGMIGVHPNTNTATVFMKCSDLTDLIAKRGNRVIFMDAGGVCGSGPAL